MTHTATAHTDSNNSSGVETLKLGMWIFLASEVMFFTGLIGSYIVLRLGSETWPNPNELLDLPLLSVNTFILICSSVTMVTGLQACQQGNKGKQVKMLLATAFLGLAFLCIKGYDYYHLYHNGHTLNSSLFFSCYFTLTGFHGAHVLAGVITLLVMALRSMAGQLPAAKSNVIESAGLYWHFVDLVWIILFAILCLV